MVCVCVCVCVCVSVCSAYQTRLGFESVCIIHGNISGMWTENSVVLTVFSLLHKNIREIVNILCFNNPIKLLL
jgi:hypothetical protein